MQAFEATLGPYPIATEHVALAGGIGALRFHLLLGIGFSRTLRKPKAHTPGRVKPNGRRRVQPGFLPQAHARLCTPVHGEHA